MGRRIWWIRRMGRIWWNGRMGRRQRRLARLLHDGWRRTRRYGRIRGRDVWRRHGRNERTSSAAASVGWRAIRRVGLQWPQAQVKLLHGFYVISDSIFILIK